MSSAVIIEQIQREQVLATRMLKGILARGEVSPAYLFFGPDVFGQAQLTEWFIRSLLCLGSTPSEACGTCATCAGDLLTHPDVHRVEAKPGRATISIEQVRDEVRTPLSRRAFSGRYKIVHIREAERLTPPAQNALLKTLEDPQGPSVLLLNTPSAERLLPTVRSRCVKIPFRTLSESAFISRLNEQLQPEGPVAWKVLYMATGGDVEQATKMLSADFREDWDRAVSIWDQLSDPKTSPARLSRWAEEVGASREEADAFLIHLLTCIRDQIAPSETGALQQYAMLVEVIMNTQDHLRLNANRRLALEVCLMQLQHLRLYSYN